jgi:hypothetical protein
MSSVWYTSGSGLFFAPEPGRCCNPLPDQILQRFLRHQFKEALHEQVMIYFIEESSYICLHNPPEAVLVQPFNLFNGIAMR